MKKTVLCLHIQSTTKESETLRRPTGFKRKMEQNTLRKCFNASFFEELWKKQEQLMQNCLGKKKSKDFQIQNCA